MPTERGRCQPIGMVMGDGFEDGFYAESDTARFLIEDNRLVARDKAEPDVARELTPRENAQLIVALGMRLEKELPK